MAFVHLGADYFMRDVYGATGAMKYGFAVVWPDGRVAMVSDGTEATRTYDLVGPLCFAGDVLARDLVLPELAEGDWLVIAGTGANTLGLWSRHCSRAIPKVIASSAGTCRVWSEREAPK
jgi:diaminopimelate decarboxylase